MLRTTEFAARLEGSKIFTRQVTTAVKVPAPNSAIAKTHEELDNALDNWKSGLPVVKADGHRQVFLPDNSTVTSCSMEN